MTRRITLLTLLLAAGALSGVARADLAAFVAKPEPEFNWTKQSEETLGTTKVINLKLRSQVWREIPWDHAIQIFLPPAMKHPRTALLLITGGNPNAGGLAIGSAIAGKVEAPVAILNWVWPTPWRQWEQDGQYLRRNVFTGERHVLRECGCLWIPCRQAHTEHEIEGTPDAA